MAKEIILPPNSKAIPLTREEYAIVDEADYEWLNQWKWCCTNRRYAVRNEFLGKENGKQKFKNIIMHRLIIMPLKYIIRNLLY